MKPAFLPVLCVLVAAAAVAQDDTLTLKKEAFLDKCKGAWVGQMFGVCYAGPHEFQSNGAIIEGDLRGWKPEYMKESLGQDDIYVEMTFLEALEEHGLDISHADAGKAFAASEYPLWHANYYGRENIRAGIMPPLSGHPSFNRHADDIDFQIEADLFGILCPAMPHESNRLCDVFGHIMNYGDGVYGGMFVSGMYAAAYTESEDVGKVVQSGLDCIPAQSQYYACIADVVRWHGEDPVDWRATWQKIEDKWQDDMDCSPREPFNIDAKLNGAYIVMGLLYGNGDMLKTAEIATRCGQDSDCNASNATGVLGCMLGYNALDESITSGVAPMGEDKFIYTKHSFNSLIEACQSMTEAIVARAGGEITDDAYLIPRQAPKAPATFEQWVDQSALLETMITDREMATWDPRFTCVACGTDMSPGILPHLTGRKSVLVLHPVDQDTPAAIEGRLEIPEQATALRLDLASHPQGNYTIRASVDGSVILDEVVDSAGQWTSVTANIAPWRGKEVLLRIENAANGDWNFEAAFIDDVVVE